MVTDNIQKSLRDTLAIYFIQSNDGSYDNTVDEMRDTLPDALRLIAEWLKKDQPNAVFEINTFNECADFLESYPLEKTEEEYWNRNARLTKLAGMEDN